MKLNAAQEQWLMDYCPNYPEGGKRTVAALNALATTEPGASHQSTPATPADTESPDTAPEADTGTP